MRARWVLKRRPISLPEEEKKDEKRKENGPALRSGQAYWAGKPEGSKSRAREKALSCWQVLDAWCAGEVEAEGEPEPLAQGR